MYSYCGKLFIIHVESLSIPDSHSAMNASVLRVPREILLTERRSFPRCAGRGKKGPERARNHTLGLRRKPSASLQLRVPPTVGGERLKPPAHNGLRTTNRTAVNQDNRSALRDRSVFLRLDFTVNRSKSRTCAAEEY